MIKTRAPQLAGKLTAAIFLSALCATAAIAESTQVTIGQGIFNGIRDGDISTFLGIPFAAAPVGSLRWKPPVPLAQSSQAIDAKVFGPSCPQAGRGERQAGRTVGAQSEDCLNLNVWTKSTTAKAPVMVWLHGGGHRVGTGSMGLYNGSGLAQQGVVVVTINYRLGLLGYFAHPALTAEATQNAPLGNYGLMDQMAALQWVQTNIAKFGGDPANVTVFGESAGAASTLYLLATPSAKGLFNKAIVQSGGGLQSPKNLSRAETDGQDIAQDLGLASTATVHDLRNIPIASLISAQPNEGLGFGEIIDGRLVVETPAAAFESGRANDVPLLIGANSNEGSVMANLNIPETASAAFLGNKEAEVRAIYGGAAISNAEFVRQVFGDATFVGPARWIAGKAASGAPAFLYHYDYVLERRRGAQPGASHGAEIPHIFRSWDQIPFAYRLLTARDKDFSAMISACWVEFAKSGAPACFGLPTWQPYTPSSDILMELSPNPGPRAQFRKQMLDAVIPPTATSTTSKPLKQGL